MRKEGAIHRTIVGASVGAAARDIRYVDFQPDESSVQALARYRRLVRWRWAGLIAMAVVLTVICWLWSRHPTDVLTIVVTIITAGTVVREAFALRDAYYGRRCLEAMLRVSGSER